MSKKLFYNLQEIYSAIKSDECHEKLVVADFWNNIYDAQCCWGRIWVFFYNITAIFKCTKHLEMRCLEKAMQTTHKLFEANLILVNSHVERFQEYVRKSSQNFPQDDPLKTSRKVITAWTDNVLPFLTLNDEHFKKLTAGYSFTVTKECRDKIKHVQRMIDFEGLLKGPAPFYDLENLALKKIIDESKKREIITWFHNLNKKFTIGKLHNIFISFMKILKVDEPDILKYVVRIEFTFHDLKKNNILYKDNERHLRWRDSLTKGSKLDHFVLGNQLGEQGEYGKVVIFEIENNPHEEVWIANNKAILGVLAKGRHKRHVTIKYIYDEGKYATVEKLLPLNSIIWTANNKEFSKKEQVICSSVKKWIIELLQNKTSYSLNPKNLVINEAGEIKYRKFLSKLRKLDHIALEEFIFYFSANNLVIFRNLMEPLKNNMHTEFFRYVFEKTAMNKKLDVRSIAYNFGDGIKDANVVTTAEKFQQMVRDLRERCIIEFDKERERCIKEIDKEKEVGKKMIELYKYTQSGHILWPNFQKAVIAHLKNPKQTIADLLESLDDQ